SLGAILYEMLTGRPPFKEDNPLDTLVQVIEGEPPPPRSLDPKIPRGLELICLRCLEKDPQRRYATAADMADDLERYLRGELVEGRAGAGVAPCGNAGGSRRRAGELPVAGGRLRLPLADRLAAGGMGGGLRFVRVDDPKAGVGARHPLRLVRRRRRPVDRDAD